MGITLSSAGKKTRCFVALLLLAASVIASRAEIIFDVFVGFGLGAADGVVAEASWFPVTCEIQNNGPTFNGSVEIVGGQFGNGMRRVVPLELPSGTKKRFTVPVYCAGRFRTVVDARLRNEKGKVLLERLGQEPRLHVDSLSPLIASLPRTHGGAASLPEPAKKSTQLQPAATHLSTENFPENPLALDGMSMLYLHSSKAVELKVPQITALMAWLHAGGRLVLGVEQPGDVNALPWLQTVLPCELGDASARGDHKAIHDWLTDVSGPDDFSVYGTKTRSTPNAYAKLVADSTFEGAPMQVISAKLRDGTVIAGSREAPLMLSAPRGRGELVVLLFSPELEPFRSWANRPWFWAKLGRVPMVWLASGNASSYPNTPMDGVFGAMVDSKQIRKLPIGWLLLLLIIYLVVIGPLDQYWLKKINRQMLTWITFPAYVAIFSGLIYFIGYTLRSGESEWNELQVVDIVPHGVRADLRGRTYGSAYSPINASYNLASDQGYSTLRGEVSPSTGEHFERDDRVEQRGNSFAAQVNVPVWTSQLYVNDWWRQEDLPPLNFTVRASGNGYDVKISNPRGRRIAIAKLVIEDQVYEMGAFSQDKTMHVSRGTGQSLTGLVQGQQGRFQSVVSQRQRQFGDRYSGHIDDIFMATVAASFMASVVPDADSSANNQPYQYYGRFISPRGFDLAAEQRRGGAVLIAYAPDQTLATPLNKFNPRASRKNTIMRVIARVEQ